MSKLSRKRVRVPGPVTSTQNSNTSTNLNDERPSPHDRSEAFFRRQLEIAITESENKLEKRENFDKNKEQSHEPGVPKGNKRLAKECNNPKPVYCICREGERPGMIGCDFCDEWYHTQCLGLTKDEAKRISNEKWSCVKCKDDDVRRGSRDQIGKCKKQSTDKEIHLDEYSANDLHGANYSESSISESDNSDEEFLIINSKQKKDKKQCRMKAVTKEKITPTNTKINKNDVTAANYLSRAKNENTNPFQDDDEIEIPSKLSKLNPGVGTKEALPSKSEKPCLPSKLPGSTLTAWSASNTSVSRSISVPRKWKPPTMSDGKTNTFDNRDSNETSPNLSTPLLGHIAPRLRVGLTRNFKSPKPLHSSLKWTP